MLRFQLQALLLNTLLHFSEFFLYQYSCAALFELTELALSSTATTTAGRTKSNCPTRSTQNKNEKYTSVKY
ncbi:hypothetical protein PF005_g4596 [Phytophthora fragariae]|uniref:Secreted protein n=2 Tax=Phytophthora TaxID=4783 RepID=A0A6A3F7G3_9STRA|nr:hypothetical protein PF003_g28570 [Phytophthora fragariae]KAE8954501.1 hypothetical protein PR001_g32466 [Phytophthora rubi]KAE8941289.1 hypothetical protein PF009_g8920 [Phytophthora fragariae]KAE9023865.1 hypothetical protein PF011_g3778 [Phytophthora fragariae]KAE9121489.1 hypothetical protein PF007_g7787 [Phytophthora fragariae]